MPTRSTASRIRALFGGDAASGIAMAAVVGLVTGLGAIGFRTLVNEVSRLVFRGAPPLEQAASLPWAWLVGMPAIGLCAAWGLTTWLAPEARGHGVPEVMLAVAQARGRIRARVALVKSAASALTMGFGGSVGREGPIVQIGSALGSAAGQLLRAGEANTRLLVACGAAAGIAATFNAPMAGVIFAVEIVLGSAAIHTFSPIVVSSVVATAIARGLVGGAAAFRVPAHALESPAELISYVLLGIVAGVVGVAFIRALYGLEDLFEKMPVPAWVLPPLAGMAVGAIGLLVPDVYGLGYETIELALHNEVAPLMLGALIAAKLAATSLTLAGGGSGGVFAPSLFLGATVGGALGSVAQSIAPWATASPGAYALVGMGAVVAATTHAPLTAIVIIFELTGDYAIILPLMLACIVGSVVSVAIQRESIYTLKLVRRGIRIGAGEASALLTTPVRDLVRDSPATLSPDLPFDDVVHRVINSSQAHHYVVDDDQKLLGLVALHELKCVLKEDMPAGVATAHDVMSTQTHAVRIEDNLDTCLYKFAEGNVDELPVTDVDRLVGMLKRQDVMGLYHRTLLHQDALGMLFVTHEGEDERHDYVELPEGHVVDTVEIPAPLAGKTLRELNLRAEHGLLVVGLRRKGAFGLERTSPDPGTPIAEGTILVIVGPADGVAWMRSLHE